MTKSTGTRCLKRIMKYYPPSPRRISKLHSQSNGTENEYHRNTIQQRQGKRWRWRNKPSEDKKKEAHEVASSGGRAINSNSSSNSTNTASKISKGYTTSTSRDSTSAGETKQQTTVEESAKLITYFIVSGFTPQ
ncbi:hypothetical protein CHS0354_014823 [Potamilus streckersoni]|uniref:Uncharacterized protein n=1 Tax=Potamilus streckersoni TaxID=2493646 RepID=A0AAE0VKS7_9BIVA|nr:hypothetical protein CHS0354_014823 [Potamilus streckersoni]